MASSWRATYLSYAATSRVICSSFRHVIHVYRSAMFFTYNTSLKAWHTCHRTSMILFHLASLFYKIFERWKVTKRFHNLRGGTQKFPELLKEIYLKYLYKFETLVPFEVSPPATGCSNPSTAPNDSSIGSGVWDCCIQSQGEYFERDYSFKLVQILYTLQSNVRTLAVAAKQSEHYHRTIRI